MNSSSISDREAILKAIKRKPGVAILEIAQSLDIPRRSISAHIRRLQCDGVIKAIPLPARPGIDEIRSGYELAPKLVVVEPAPMSRPASPAQWDPLAFLFGRATVES